MVLKINEPSIVYADTIGAQSPDLIVDSATESTEPTIRMDNLEARYGIRIWILVHHPADRTGRDTVTKRLSNGTVCRDLPRWDLSDKIIGVLEKIHKEP